MSWVIDLTKSKKEIGAELESEKQRLTPLLANLPTECEDMRATLDRAKFYAEEIDLDLYNATYGAKMNAIRVQAGGSHSTIWTNESTPTTTIVCASFRLDVTPVLAK